MRLTIRQKIMAIAVGLIITMALAAVLSTSLTMKVVDRLQDLKNAYVPAYASLARTDIRSLERALTLRRMIIDRLRSPAGSSRFAELRKLFDETGMAMENEAKDGQALIDLMIAEGVGDPVALTRLEASIDSTLNETRRYLNAEIERLWPVLESGDAGRIDEGLKRVDDLRDDLNERLDENRRSMRELLENAVSETESEAERAMLIASVLTVLATALGLIFAYLVSSGVTRPVHRLLDGTRALESGQLDRPLAVTSRDEIGDLTTAFNHMVEQLRLKERIRETFGKFVDPRIVASMISDDAANAERVERRIVTVFFSDIAGFTSISEELAPGAIVNLLNNYFSAVTAPIRASNGIVDKYMGDGVMAFWSPPFSEGDSHAASACRAALAQQDAVEQLNKELPNILGLRRGTPVLSVRMGLATGEAIVGTMGSATSKTFTVMGDTVNLASRLEGANKIYGTKIIVTAETVALASDEIAFRELDLITVAGRTEPVHIYEVLGTKDAFDPRDSSLRDAFAHGLEAYRAQDWAQAERQFQLCLELNPKDGPARTFAGRIAQFRHEPPPPGWDGVWRLADK
jgi:adenylate cyclase